MRLITGGWISCLTSRGSAVRSRSVFESKEQEFYVNIRCGILHQGETTGGWKITRAGKTLFDSAGLIVDSVSFARQLQISLEQYSAKLKVERWDSETWDNFRIKMRKIIANCKK